jgi:XRE family transcriptional regulator, master regulator for biofilm formation
VVNEIREQRGMTQVELARAAKVTQGYVTMIETGVRKNPSLAILKRLAKALGVPVGELLS